jgi:hypothetical protein
MVSLAELSFVIPGSSQKIWGQECLVGSSTFVAIMSLLVGLLVKLDSTLLNEHKYVLTGRWFEAPADSLTSLQDAG